MWRITRLCFRSSECLIKCVFFIHFVLFFAHWLVKDHAVVQYVFANCFLLLALAAALAVGPRGHHLANLAGLIDFSCILVDVLVFWDKFASEWDSVRSLPFLGNLAFRVVATILLLQLGPGDSAEECASHKRSQRTLEAIIADSNNNSSNRYATMDDSIEVGVGPAKRLLDNKTTEV